MTRHTVVARVWWAPLLACALAGAGSTGAAADPGPPTAADGKPAAIALCRSAAFGLAAGPALRDGLCGEGGAGTPLADAAQAPPGRTDPLCGVPGVDDRCELVRADTWTTPSRSVGVALSPDGRTVYSVSESWNYVTGLWQMVVFATDTATGEPRWSLDTAGFGPDAGWAHRVPLALALSPDGQTLYVTGGQDVSRSGGLYSAFGDSALFLTALAADDGRLRWDRVIRGARPAPRGDILYGLQMEVTAATAYVLGLVVDPDAGGGDVALYAFAAADGATAWTARERTSSRETPVTFDVDEAAGALAVASTVGDDYQVTRYRLESGAPPQLRWTRRGSLGFREVPVGIALTPTGVTVAGSTFTRQELATQVGPSAVWAQTSEYPGRSWVWAATYDHDSGSAVWARIVPQNGWFLATAMRWDPAQDFLYIAGAGTDGSARLDTFVTRLSGATGHLEWVRPAGLPGVDEVPTAITLSADSRQLYLAGIRLARGPSAAVGGSSPVARVGTCADLADPATERTVVTSLRTVDGLQSWTATAERVGSGADVPAGLVTDPGTGMVYVQGTRNIRVVFKSWCGVPGGPPPASTNTEATRPELLAYAG